MNRRIKKKKWKQAAKRSKAEIEELVRKYGVNDNYVQHQIFGHYLIFGEDIRKRACVAIPDSVIDMLFNAVQK